MKNLFWLLVAGGLSGCAGPTKPLTSATSQATALVRLAQEFELLAPMLQNTTGPPLVTLELAPKPSATNLSEEAEAAAMLRESPDLINRMMTFAPGSLLVSEPGNLLISRTKQQPAIQQRLQSMLAQRPDLDLVWYWLADVENTDSAAITDLSRAISLNPQVGEYYQRRGLRYESLRKYAAGISDLQRAAPFFHSPWEVYRQLADLYVLAGDDGRYQALWEQRQRGMRQALAQLDSPGPHGLSQLADVGQLRAEINYGYLARAEYYIERRHQPTLACPDLERAVAAGVEEARILQKTYCQ